MDKLIRKIYYTESPILTTLLTSDTAVTIVTENTIEYHNQNMENPIKIILQVPQQHSIVRAQFCARQGQVELLLAILQSETKQYLVVLETGNGKIQFATPAYASILDFVYFDNQIYYVAENKVYSWNMQIQPELFYQADIQINQIQFAEILFKQHLIIAGENLLFSIDTVTKTKQLDFTIKGTPIIVLFNKTLNHIFVQTKEDPFFIFDLNTTLTFNLQPPYLHYSYSGSYKITHIIATEQGYLATCNNGQIYSLKVQYEVPSSQFNETQQILLNQAAFTFIVTNSQTVFNNEITFLGFSRISTDYFMVGTKNCIICGKTSNIDQCTDEVIGLGITENQHQLILKTRLSLMKSDQEQYDEFFQNIIKYQLGDVNSLLTQRFKQVGLDLYYLVQSYSFTEVHDLIQTTDSPWFDLDNEIQLKPDIEDEQQLLLNPQFMQKSLKIMLNTETAQQDQAKFVELIFTKFVKDPFYAAKNMQLSAYVKAYFPHICAIVWNISKQYHEGQEKLESFKEHMEHKSNFLLNNFKNLNSNIESFEQNTKQAQQILNDYVTSYNQQKLQLLEEQYKLPTNINIFIKEVMPLYIKNKVSENICEQRMLQSFNTKLQTIVNHFIQSSNPNLMIEGKNSVSETILDQKQYYNSQFYTNLQKLNIGYGKVEKFCFQPLPVNSIQLHINEIDQNIIHLLREINSKSNMQQQIEAEFLIFDDFLCPYELYDFTELYSATNLLFIVTDFLKNTSQLIFDAISQTNIEYKGKFQLLNLYDIRTYDQDNKYQKVYFQKPPTIFRLSDIISQITQSLSWQNVHKKHIFESDRLQKLLAQFPIGLKQVKQIFANLLSFINFVQTQDLCSENINKIEDRVVGIDPTLIFIDIVTLEVHVPYLFERIQHHRTETSKICCGVNFSPPEVVFGIQHANSDVWNCALIYLMMYHCFVQVPKQKQMKKSDIRPFQQIIYNYPYFIDQIVKISQDNFNFKSKNNKQTPLPQPQAIGILAMLQAAASLSTDITDIPNQLQVSKIMQVYLKGSSDQISQIQDYFTKSITQPFINPAQNVQAKDIFSYNKGKLFKFIELTEKSIQNLIKKALVFNAHDRISASEFMQQWKCDREVRKLKEEIEISVEKKLESVIAFQLQCNIEISSGDDLSISNRDSSDSETSCSDSVLERLANGEQDSEKPIEEEAEEENFEDMSEHEVAVIKEKKQLNSQLEAFKELYIAQYGEIPEDMDIEAIMKEQTQDMILPEFEDVGVMETSDPYKNSDINYYQDVVENPDKFVVPEPVEDAPVVTEVKPYINSAANDVVNAADIYAAEEEHVEEYNIPSDYAPEKSDEVPQQEELPWYVLAAQEEEKQKDQLKQQKVTKKEKRAARDQKVIDGELESDDDSYYYEDETEEETAKEPSQKEDEKETTKSEEFCYENSDKPLWEQAEDAPDKEVIYDENGEAIDMDFGDLGGDKEIMIDDDGRAFYVDEEGTHYIE